MIIKKKLAAAVAAVCVLTSGVLPNALSTQAIGAKNWLDLSLKVSSNNVKPGEKVEVTVVARGFNGDSDIGGLQIKLNDGYASSSEKAERLKLVEIRHGEDQLPAKSVFSNTDYGEFAMWSGVEGTTIKETQNVNLVTYVYEVPENAANTTYGFNVDMSYTFFCDTDGEPIDFERNFSYANIEINNGDVPKEKQVTIDAVPYLYQVSPGEEFTVDVAMRGDDAPDVAGFQFKLNMPDYIECLGLAETTTSNGTALTFNPKTREVAAASQIGEPIGFKSDDKIAKIRFKVPADYFQSSTVTFGVTDAFVSDSEGNEIKAVSMQENRLQIVDDSPSPSEPDGLLGDANLDKKVDSSDASAVLGEYSELATSGKSTFTVFQQKKNADVNFDGKIDSKDASDILAYYSFCSTGGKGTMEEWIANFK